MGPQLRHAECALRRIYQLRKTKTNIQILQQNVLLKQKYMVTFLRQHGPEVFHEMRSAYVETLSRVLSSHFRSYLAALERLQVSTLLNRSDLWGKGRWRYTPYAAIPALPPLGAFWCSAESGQSNHLCPSPRSSVQVCCQPHGLPGSSGRC